MEATFITYRDLPLGFIEAGKLVVAEEILGFQLAIAVIAAKQQQTKPH